MILPFAALFHSFAQAQTDLQRSAKRYRRFVPYERGGRGVGLDYFFAFAFFLLLTLLNRDICT